jgi:hypothetical protein
MLAGGWDESLKSSQEYNLMFRLLKKFGESRVLIDSKPLTIVRERESGQISSTDLGGNLDRYLKERETIKEWLKLNEPSIFASNKDALMQHFIKYCHYLADYSFDEALKIHNRNVPLEFKLKQEDGISKIYVFLYNLLGFKKAEQIKMMNNMTSIKESSNK